MSDTEPGEERKERSLTGKRILVVDDEEDVRILMSRLLELEGGAEIVEAKNGAEALEKIKGIRKVGEKGKEEKGFDALIIDLEMPEMDGLTLLAELQKQEYVEILKETKIIVASAGQKRETERTLEENEVTLDIGVVFEKPLPLDFVEVVTNLLVPPPKTPTAEA